MQPTIAFPKNRRSSICIGERSIGQVWDFSAVLLRRVDRRPLPEADVQCSPAWYMGTSEAGPKAKWQVSADNSKEAAMVSLPLIRGRTKRLYSDISEEAVVRQARPGARVPPLEERSTGRGYRSGETVARSGPHRHQGRGKVPEAIISWRRFAKLRAP